MKVNAVHAYFKMSQYSKACIQCFISLPVFLHVWICGFTHQFITIKKATLRFPLLKQLCRWTQRFQVNIQKLRNTTDQRSYFHLRISGEFLWAPEHKSVLPLPCPVEEVTIKANSSPTAKILNSILVRWCLEKTTRMDSQLYLPAGSDFSLIAPLLQCGSCSLHLQTKTRLSIFSHLEIILPHSFPLWYLLTQHGSLLNWKGDVFLDCSILRRIH